MYRRYFHSVWFCIKKETSLPTWFGVPLTSLLVASPQQRSNKLRRQTFVFTALEAGQTFPRHFYLSGARTWHCLLGGLAGHWRFNETSSLQRNGKMAKQTWKHKPWLWKTLWRGTLHYYTAVQQVFRLSEMQIIQNYLGKNSQVMRMFYSRPELRFLVKMFKQGSKLDAR